VRGRIKRFTCTAIAMLPAAWWPAAEVQVSTITLVRAIRSGRLRSAKAGRAYRIQRPWLLEWMASNSAPQGV
jgi:excisionase family DNA binding protein